MFLPDHVEYIMNKNEFLLDHVEYIMNENEFLPDHVKYRINMFRRCIQEFVYKRIRGEAIN